jgi:DDE superfamily endonuclease
VKSINHRGQHHLTWPVGEQLQKVKDGFESKWGIPQVCGAIDVTHIEVDLPGNERSTDFYDKDKNYSFILQAIVDVDTRFLNIFAGYPGVVHDARVFANSGIKAAIDRGDCLNGPTRFIQGIPIPELLIGDAGYTQTTYMLIPLPGYKLTPMCNQYNFKHSSTRMVVERSFGILKGVWQILKRPMYMPDCVMVSSIMHTTCILHNIMLDREDRPDDELPLARHHDEGYRQQINMRVITDEALLIKNAIVEHLWHLEGLQQ